MQGRCWARRPQFVVSVSCLYNNLYDAKRWPQVDQLAFALCLFLDVCACLQPAVLAAFAADHRLLLTLPAWTAMAYLTVACPAWCAAAHRLNMVRV